MTTILKRCGACRDFWPPDKEHFYEDESRDDGLSPYCRFCKRDKASVFYYDNWEKVRTSQKQAYANNLEEKRLYNREYQRRYRQAQKQPQTATP